MSESKTLTPLEVVERYHKRYLEYEAAFNKDPFTEQQRQEEVLKIVESGIDVESEEFLDKMTDLMIEKPYKMMDVNNSALKFILFVDFYLLTQEEELPKNILEDYNSLPIKDNLRSFFSIKDGEFVRNEEREASEELKNYFKQTVNQLKSQGVR